MLLPFPRSAIKYIKGLVREIISKNSCPKRMRKEHKKKRDMDPDMAKIGLDTLTWDAQTCYVSCKLVGQTDFMLVFSLYFSCWPSLFANVEACLWS